MESESQGEELKDDELKLKLRQIRSSFTRSRNILEELETYYKTFEELRAKLDDQKDGLAINLTWSQSQKEKIDQIITGTDAKIKELETLSESAKSLVGSVQAQYDAFIPLAARLNDPSTGIDAILANASNLRNKIESLLQTARIDAAAADESLEDIKAKHTDVKEAYDAFMKLKEEYDDPESGIQAQVESINKFAKDAAKAKNDTEAELSSVISLKTTAAENLDSIKDSKTQIEEYQSESQSLTNDIRNNLGLSSADSLSRAIKTQRERFDRTVMWWSIAVWFAVALLASGLWFVYYTLFVDSNSSSYLLDRDTIDGWSIVVTVLSKAIFSSPLVFALYFTTSNFSRVRELRDYYIGKEIAATNLQAYVKLLRDEFGEYEEKRLDFTLRNMQAIYDDPTLNKKKRRYNIGVNKIFQFDVQEEDIQSLKDTLVEGAEELLDKKKTEDKA
jgi:DNA repair exonuclease SbcCD ATPase subunit